MYVIRKLQKCIQKIERECNDENVFLKVDRALSKMNFLSHLKSKTNLVTLIECNLHLQYCKIDFSFGIEFQQLKLNVCVEFKTECDETLSAKRSDYTSLQIMGLYLLLENERSFPG